MPELLCQQQHFQKGAALARKNASGSERFPEKLNPDKQASPDPNSTAAVGTGLGDVQQPKGGYFLSVLKTRHLLLLQVAMEI